MWAEPRNGPVELEAGRDHQRAVLDPSAARSLYRLELRVDVDGGVGENSIPCASSTGANGTEMLDTSRSPKGTHKSDGTNTKSSARLITTMRCTPSGSSFSGAVVSRGRS